MTVVELLKMLETMVSDDKGNYTVFDEGYVNEISAENVNVDDKRQRVYL